ncbi:MAG: hypothetical protein J6C63_03805 [Lachnospiraceae bacterium]|nr:hypothetical protein [Lachnospiraceae bacterium]
MNSNKDNKKSYLPNQSMLAIKAVLGGYLVYLAYDVMSTEILTGPRIGITLFCILFVIAGVMLLFSTIRSFIRGEYVGGKADFTEDEYEEENNQPVIDDNANDNGSERMP